jgi:hypothetical protein
MVYCMAEESMKKNYMYPVFIWFSLFLTALSAYGADQSLKLPASWSHELQAATKSLIQAGLEQDDAVLMTKTMIQARFNRRQIIEAQHIIGRTIKNNLPVEPVMNKAYEGMAKQVPAQSIVRAMKQVKSRYEHAYALAGQLSKQKDTVHQLGREMAAGLAAGMSRKDMDQLVQQLQHRERQMDPVASQKLASECLLTARDMARQGVSSATAAQVVNRAMEKGFGAREMRSMRSSFMHRGARGSAESLAKSYSKAIASGKNPGQGPGNSGRGHGFDGHGEARGDGGSGDGGHGDGGGSGGGSDGGHGGGDSDGSGGDSSGGSGGGSDGGSGGHGGDSDGGSGSGGHGGGGSGGGGHGH